jgi:hypothetical protein
MEEAQTDILKYVIHRNKEDLLALKKPILERRKDITIVASSLKSIIQTVRRNEHETVSMKQAVEEIGKTMETK